MCKTNNRITEENASKQRGLHISGKNAPGMKVPERLKVTWQPCVPSHKRIIVTGVGVNLLFKEEATTYFSVF